MHIARRRFLQSASAAALAIGFIRSIPGREAASFKSPRFPENFLWGCATAGHQVEGNNVSSDMWTVEHLSGSVFKEPSADACDHYHLYPLDISMLADLGFNTYRFSLEWSRIEPEEGAFSNAALEHYRRMLVACREHRLTTLLTYSHFSVPRWFADKGGWQNPASISLFARFCERATRYLGDLVDFASTFNEPNVPQLLNWQEVPEKPGKSVGEALLAALAQIRKQLNNPAFATFFMGDAMKMRENLLASHEKARAAMKSVRPTLPVGFSLAIFDDQAPPRDSHVEAKRADVYGPWLEAARQCDYLGVQTYTRVLVGPKDIAPAKGVELTQIGWEFYPECVEHVVRYASQQARVPIIVTENGVATDDDTRRIEYFRRALAGLKRAMDDGVDVRGYVAWSLLDNFEWTAGYAMKFGIVAVDRQTQKRTIKPSAAFLGNIARRNSL